MAPQKNFSDIVCGAAYAAEGSAARFCNSVIQEVDPKNGFFSLNFHNFFRFLNIFSIVTFQWNFAHTQAWFLTARFIVYKPLVKQLNQAKQVALFGNKSTLIFFSFRACVFPVFCWPCEKTVSIFGKRIEKPTTICFHPIQGLVNFSAACNEQFPLPSR